MLVNAISHQCPVWIQYTEHVYAVIYDGADSVAVEITELLRGAPFEHVLGL